MKAIEVKEPNQLRLIEKEKPIIQKENEVLIKVKAVGICGSDIHILHGTSPVATYPRVIGHEIVGVIEEIGSGVTNLSEGDRIIVEPIDYCGKCYACKKGRGNVCQSLQVRGVHIDGGFQECLVVDEKWAHKLPENITDEQAVMIEPYTIGYQATERGNVGPNDVVFIFGAGPAGLIALDVAKSKGAMCYISDLNDQRLELAKAFGADDTFNPTKINVEEKIMEITKGMGPNVVFDAVGMPKIFAQAIEMASVAGTVVSMGFSSELAPVSMLDITKKELDVVGTRLQSNKFKVAIKTIESKLDKIDQLITHVFDYTDYEEAFRLAESNSQDVGKIVIRFS